MDANTGDAKWVPFGVEDEIDAYQALDPSVMPWLSTSLWRWIGSSITTKSAGGYTYLDIDLVRRAERILRVPLATNLENVSPEGAIAHLQKVFTDLGDQATWQFVDFILAESPRIDIPLLESLLIEAGSAWSVGVRMGKIGIVKRLPEGVVVAADKAFQFGDAGKRLESAWKAAFGVNPDPEAAYSRAIKAVEDAAIPVVSPKNSSATLGTVIRDIRDSGKFKLPHLREHKDAKTHDVLLSMLQMLWTGQHDRHGGPSAIAVPNVTQAEAETAVTLALTLVTWFETNKVQ